MALMRPHFFARGPFRPKSLWLVAAVLALGTGPVAAMFGLLRATLFHPLPFPAPSRLVAVQSLSRFGLGGLTRGQVEQWGSASALFRAFGTFRPASSMGIAAPSGSWTIPVVAATPTMFAALAVRPALGSLFRPGDARAILLSNSLWRLRFGSDPNVVGKPVSCSGQQFVISGVMPPGFSFPKTIYPRWPSAPQAWIPLQFNAGDEHNADFLGIGRLRTGVSLEEAKRALAAAPAPAGNQSGARAAVVTGLHHFAFQESRLQLDELAAGAVLLFLLACLNAVALLLAKAEARRRDFAVCVALGASRARLVRDALAEVVRVGAIAATGAILFAVAGSRTLVALLPITMPKLGENRVDLPTVAFAAAVALAAALLAVLPSVMRAAAADPIMALKANTNAPVRKRAGVRPMEVAAAVQVALVVVLAAAATATGERYYSSARAQPGFVAHDLYLTSMMAPGGDRTPAAERRFAKSQANALANLRGQFAFSSSLPGIYADQIAYSLRGPLAKPALGGRSMDYQIVSGNYFKVMGIPVIGGRPFDASDVRGGTPAVVVDSRAARIIAPAEPPSPAKAIGRHIWLQGVGEAVVVGLVAPVRKYGDPADANPQVFLALDQNPLPGFMVVARTPLSAQGISDAVRAALPAQQALRAFESLPVRIARELAPARLSFTLLALFGALAALIAGFGVYSTCSFTLALRRRELAIRGALGASRWGLAQAILGGYSRFLVPGLLLGAFAAIAATPLVPTAASGASGGGGAALLLALALVSALIALAAAGPALAAVRQRGVDELNSA